MLEGAVSGYLAGKIFPEKDLFKIVKRHAFWGALIMMLPDFGFGTIFFVIILWRMYTRLADKVGVSFLDNFWKLVGFGLLVNIIVAFAIDLLMTALFFLEGFIIYFQFYFSGKMFINVLKSEFDA